MQWVSRDCIHGHHWRMNDFPPPAPPLADEDVRALIGWMDATAAWLREEHAEAQSCGHVISNEATANLRLYEDAAILMREAYDTNGG